MRKCWVTRYGLCRNIRWWEVWWWYLDTWQRRKYCVSDRGMFDVRDINENIRVGNGNLLVATKIGSIKFKVIHDEGLENEIRSGVWSEYANTVTFLSNITFHKSNNKCPYQLLFRSTAKLPSSLRPLEKRGVVTTKSDIQGKLTNCGTTCMFMGYSVNHSNDVNWMLNL